MTFKLAVRDFPPTSSTQHAPLSLRCYSCPCDIKKRPVWVEAEKPVPLKIVAPYVRDEAEPVVRPATDANGRVVAGFQFSGECSIQPGGKGAQGGERR